MLKNVLNSQIRYGANVGFSSSFLQLGFVKGLIFCGSADMLLHTTDAQTLKTAIAAALIADDPAQRMYPVQGFVSPSDNSEADVTQTFADGSKALVREGKNDWTFQFVDGGQTLLNALRTANGLNRPFYVITQDGLLIGTQADGDYMAPIKPNFAWSSPAKLNTGAAVTEYKTNVNFDPADINENIAFVDFKLLGLGGYRYLKTLKGLQDVTVSKVSRAANVLKVSLTASYGTISLGMLFGATLGVIGAWAVKAANGNALTLTAAAYDPNTDAYTLTVDTTDTDYQAAGDIIVSLIGPTELAAVPYAVKGFQTIPSIITAA